MQRPAFLRLIPALFPLSFLLVGALITSGPAAAPAQAPGNKKASGKKENLRWVRRLDARNSRVEFQVKAKILNVRGQFREFRLGEFRMSGDKLESMRGTLLISTASVYTKNNKRDNHLRAEDFFWSGKYPYAIARVVDLKQEEDELYNATLVLRIRNKERRYVVPAEIERKGDRIIIRGKFSVNRRHFDLTGDYARNLIMNDEADISFTLVLLRR